jgi:electron transfer flavoprotein alpha subunit
MSVLVYVENAGGKFKKSTFEVVSYAAALSKQLNTELIAISIGDVDQSDLNKLGNFGAKKVLNVSNDQLKTFVNQAYASIIAAGAKKDRCPFWRSCAAGTEFGYLQPAEKQSAVAQYPEEIGVIRLMGHWYHGPFDLVG